MRTTEPTPRELQVLYAVTEPGASYATAARRLGISVHTVKATLRVLYAKLDVHSAGQALRALERVA